ncbi:hypothetical protein [Floridanema evergladense]|uniref:Uncharacterized protein n=1 Tax=Floridaenema evergladense BLCC-F167 TaxID=3153639 RepID=A0ABV4WGC0_9CYAN
MTYWIKFNYDRKAYIVDLDRLTGFAYEPNRRITFWLPDSSYPFVISPDANPEVHRIITAYIQQSTNIAFEEHWVRFDYEQKEYIINLKKISTFCLEPNGRITFWLPEGSLPIIIQPSNNAEAYRKIQNYIKQSTGLSLIEE